MVTHQRRKQAKGKWMNLVDPGLLSIHMQHRNISQARLAEYAGCSRQFVYQLLKGERKSCTPKLATAIEEVLNVPSGAIFVAETSHSTGPLVSRSLTHERRKKVAS